MFLDRISESGERKLWDAGITDWDKFHSAANIPGVVGARKTLYSMQLKRAENALNDGDYSYFVDKMPCAHMYRLYPFLRDSTVFLDIETTGYHGDITVIGLYDGENVMSFVRGFNLDKEIFMSTMARYKQVITFNGASFDLPMIRKYFGMDFPQVHIDLRHVLKRCGHSGGLKAIERKLGFKRDDDIKDVTGLEAVHLWRAWKHTGDRGHLDKLIKYNEADIVNLKPLADYAIKELWSRTRSN